jgi:hypothetical protein
MMMPLVVILIYIKKSIPVTGRGDTQGCKMLRPPHFLDNRLTYGSKDLSFMHWQPLTPGRFLVLISVRGSVDSRVIVQLKGVCKLTPPRRHHYILRIMWPTACCRHRYQPLTYAACISNFFISISVQFTLNLMMLYCRRRFPLAIAIYTHLFEAIFVCFSVYLRNVKEENVPAIWLLFFPHGWI